MFVNIKNGMLLRQVRGYELAARLGITPEALSEIIHGRRHAKPAIRRRMARALKAPEDWLFAEVDIPSVVQRDAEAFSTRA